MGYTYRYPHPAVTVDIAVFSIRHDALHVLLIKRAEAPYAGQWALPGGFVGIDEALDKAAARELGEETGVDAGYLEQLYTFGEPARDPRERVISVGYFALIPSDKLEIKAATDAEGVAWYPVADPPPLAFDHADILSVALARLQAKLEYSTIAFQLMPVMFTMAELRHVYELIAMAPLDKRNFSKKMLALGAIEPTGKERRDGAHRPAKLYRVVDPTRVDVIK